MKTPEEFYRDIYKKQCSNHYEYMEFADSYADYVAEKVKEFHRLPHVDTKGEMAFFQ